MPELLRLTPDAFAKRLLASGRRRAFVVRAPESPLAERGVARLVVSDPWLTPLAEELGRGSLGFQGHEAVLLEVGRATGALLAAFVHSTRRGQAQGGLRAWRHPDLASLLEDGLRLSLAMSRKCALAGLWWGGGKGILAAPSPEALAAPASREALFAEFGEFVSSLRGCYVTAEDVGTTPGDVAVVARHTRFVTCVPAPLGGSGNPAQATAEGVRCAIEAALEFAGTPGIAGRRVVVQGVGQVGSALVRALLSRGAIVIASDVDPARLAALAAAERGTRLETRAADPTLLYEACDVVAPCALGGVIDAAAVPKLRTRIVCGSANNPLADEERCAAALDARRILYVPDFVANRMGIVQCADEQYGSIPDDPALRRHFDRSFDDGVFATTWRVLETARAEGIPPLAAALRLADAALTRPHPIFPGRGRDIVAALVAGRWQDG